MKDELEILDQLEVTAELIKDETYLPTTDLDKKILKYQVKNDTMQDALLKMMALEQI